ncbi:ATP-binding protein [Conexibacter woesei]|uniref:histidine kinase n=1 Tax=Conexibacter woesei (strain DSM 14684 / CCUG 47730 / CIP 108061 / JCM 11494 / NBRC 100937 / ID131577) TaxID=469383 RepID=D3EZT1_CONWI|nr:ATP-binding protein [Conexibacter woesei]ADB53919.1 multi-sensor signal transduction histidine kinase [Conexibacter woesei DSM 14684]
MRGRGLNGRLLAGSLILLLLVAAAFAVTFASIDRLRDANRDLQRALTAVSAADRIERLAIDAETAQRGFVIAQDERFLEPYEAALRELPGAEAQLLEAMPEGDADRRANAIAGIAKVDAYVKGFVTDQIALVRRDPAAAREVVASGAGKRRMDAIRADFAVTERAERARASEVREDADDAARRAVLFALLGLLGCPLLVLAYAGYLSRLVVAPIRRVAGAAQRLASGDLTARVNEGGVAEAGVLARSFNTMASSAQHSRDELENQNAELEAQQGELERTLDALADEKERAEAFHRVVARVSAAAELDDLARVLLSEIGDLLGADVGTLYALDVSDPDGPLVLAGARGFDSAALPRRLVSGAGLAGRAVAERRAVHASHGTADGTGGESGGDAMRVATLAGEAQVGHELHIPLLGPTRVAGVLSFGRVGDAAFAGSAIDLAGRLAEPAAVGLVRALATQYAQHQAAVNMAVLETAQDAYVAADGDSFVIEWSPQAEAIFGWTAEEAIGRAIPDLIVPDRDRDFFARWSAQLLDDAERSATETRRFELVARHKDRHELTIELSIVPLRIGGGWRLNAFVRDISGRVLREREREARSDVSRVLAEVEGREQLIEPTLAALGEALQWPVVVFWLPGEHDRLTCAGTWQDPSADGLAPLVLQTRTTTLGGGAGLAARVWESGKPGWERTESDRLARGRAAAGAGLRIAGAIRVGHGAHALGVLEFWQRDAAPPDAELFDTLDAIGGQVVQVAQKRAAEAEADRLKNEFFALVSHELRTPLTSIVGYVELVLEGEVGEVNDEQARFLGIVERNGKRLQRLVGDLLFVAQVEAGTLNLEHGDATLEAIVRDAVDGARPRAEQVGVTVAAETEPVPPIRGDADRLGQLVDNLISNALKFTPSGGDVTVTLRIDGDEVALAVADTGIGIPADEQARLFDRFFRASTAVEGEIPGIGLGLSICQAIAEGHGGRIEVESEVGRGTTFRVVLPLRARLADADAAADTPAAHAATSGNGARRT